MSSTRPPRAPSRSGGRRLATAGLAALAVAVVWAGAAPPGAPRVALVSGEAIAIAQGVSVTPAPGWTLGNRGPNWVALNNSDTTAQLRITVKPGAGTDAAALLQADVDQYTGGA